MDALKIEKAILAGYDWGARTASIIAALWPERCKAMVSVNGYLINNRERNKLPLPPKVEHGWWYQFYFATERGRAGYDANRREFNKLIWKANSPRWSFDDATFDRTAASFDNPDHVAIVIANYRWRLSLVEGETRYDDLERRLAEGPVIAVPTITLDDFTTERGRLGLAANRRDLARLMWTRNSPTWLFDDATFDRSATAFDNPDYVDVVIHSYRHRLGRVAGYPAYEELERRLAAQPPITVPAVTLDGGADGVVPATDGKATAGKFVGGRQHRVLPGIGHDLPQEDPAAFAAAVWELATEKRR